VSEGATARDVAARVVARVSKEEAFAAAALEAELGHAAQLAARDRALATELVYGTLRMAPWLRSELGRFAPRGLDSIDARVMAHLEIAAYQLFFTRVPAFAAVSEAVDLVRAARGAKLAAFANAVLRKVARRAQEAGEGVREEAVVASSPAWLRAALDRSLSAEVARAFHAMGTEAPAVALRVERAIERETWKATLSAAVPDATWEMGRVSPLAILERGAGRPQSLPGWSDGAWTIQEEGSQLGALAVGAREGDRILDACSGRGNKTSLLARAVGQSGRVDACDSSPSKLARLGDELGRLGLRAGATHAVDWTVGSGDVDDTYDRVLVDAPCTGVGTLRRRPDILLRLRETDLQTRPRTQLAILMRAAERVRPGGSLVYVVCSVLREEAEDVVDGLLRARAELTPVPFDSEEARAVAGDATAFRLLPQVHGTDGYFVARFARRT
jgi:16S rRNA (cytosine967-C5)-methyltransferase